MLLGERFSDAVLERFEAVGRRAGAEPELIAQACVHVLPVAGAGLTCGGNPRIPLGASDLVAARAESLETTLGEGPCLSASADRGPVVFRARSMAARWPLFHQQLLRQTPYRSVASFALPWPDGRRFGALHLYAAEEDVFTSALLGEVNAEVAEPIRGMLFQNSAEHLEHTYSPPAWLASDAVIARMNVSIAIGQLMEAGILTDDEALATLRGYAFAHNITLDELALQLTTDQLQPGTVLS